MASGPARRFPEGDEEAGAVPETEVPQPRMFSWLNPLGLVTLGASVVLATEFGHYADRRVLEAALSPAGEPRGETPYARDEIWIDFVSDVGDAFDPTYTVARLIAGAELPLRDPLGVDDSVHRTGRGAILLMGGDQAYPWGTLERYRRHTLLPYRRAFPSPDDAAPPAVGAPPAPHVYAIPGNHDWYDGLDAFLRLFTRGTHEAPRYVGGWQVTQRRSYFARRLTSTWWVWGLDTQLSDDLDRPQREYFEARAAELDAGDNVILMTATPCWAETDKPAFDPAVGRWLDAFVAGTVEARGARLRLLLSGDSHHYAHHVREHDGLHAFTAGGGGAYTADTHHLVDRGTGADPTATHPAPGTPPGPGTPPPGPGTPGAPARGRRTRRGFAAAPDDRPGHDTGFRPCRAWPSPDRSRTMAAAILRPLRLARNNWGFAGLVGAIYLLYALAAGRWFAPGLGLVGLAQAGADEVGGHALGAVLRGLVHAPSAWLLTAVLLAGLCGFSRAASAGSKILLGGLHTAGHLVAAILVGWLGVSLARPLAGVPRPVTALLVAVVVLVVGGLLGSWVMSLYLWLADRLAACNATELMAAQRYTTYKNFLRLHVTGDRLTVYPVGVPASGRYVDLFGTTLPDPGPAPYELIEPPVDCSWRGSGRPETGAEGRPDRPDPSGQVSRIRREP